MKIIARIAAFSLVCFAIACENLDTDFESFLEEGEIIYPGIASTVFSQPGNLRTAIAWRPSADPSIERYVFYWNNQTDSIMVEATSHDPSDTISAIIPDLAEYVYSFTMYSYDGKGNRSIPKEINNVRVYGPLYEENLLNRPYKVSEPYVVNADGSIRLNFTAPDTINITTAIEYTNTSDVVTEKEIGPDESSLVLDDWKDGTIVRYRSSFIPQSGAIDTFHVTRYDTFPHIQRPVTYVLIDKGLFSALSLNNDATPYEGGTNVTKLWDGSVGPQGYPNIWHSGGGSPLPHHFSFDLGATYSDLGQIEVTGRDCCHNPDRFEVWGIDDLTGAETTLPGNDAGWKDEAIAKGWTLLKEVTRTDDGKAPYKVELNDNLPPVRYIRIRVLHVVTGDGSYSNLSEVTFWRKE